MVVDAVAVVEAVVVVVVVVGTDDILLCWILVAAAIAGVPSDCMYRSTLMAFTALVYVLFVAGDVPVFLYISLFAPYSIPLTLIHVDDSLDEDYFDIKV